MHSWGECWQSRAIAWGDAGSQQRGGSAGGHSGGECQQCAAIAGCDSAEQGGQRCTGSAAGMHSVGGSDSSAQLWLLAEWGDAMQQCQWEPLDIWRAAWLCRSGPVPGQWTSRTGVRLVTGMDEVARFFDSCARAALQHSECLTLAIDVLAGQL